MPEACNSSAMRLLMPIVPIPSMLEKGIRDDLANYQGSYEKGNF